MPSIFIWLALLEGTHSGTVTGVRNRDSMAPFERRQLVWKCDSECLRRRGWHDSHSCPQWVELRKGATKLPLVLRHLYTPGSIYGQKQFLHLLIQK